MVLFVALQAMKLQNILEAVPPKSDLLSSLRFLENSATSAATAILFVALQAMKLQNILEAAPKKSGLLSSLRFLKNSTSLRTT